MKATISAATLAVAALLSTGQDAPRAEAAIEALADGCVTCHQGALKFPADSAAIYAKLKTLVEGSAGHPTPLPPLEDNELAALARVLAGDS